MSTMVMGSGAMAADNNEKISSPIAVPVDICRSIRCQQKRGVCAGSGLSGTRFGDDQRRHLVVLHDHYLDRVTDVADRFRIGRAKTVVTTR